MACAKDGQAGALRSGWLIEDLLYERIGWKDISDMNEKIRVCLIGCGRAGMIHAKSYAGAVKGAELIAICDASEENVCAAEKAVDVKYVYTDYREALRNDEIDAVVVVTPTQFHRDIVVAAANAKKHVFCEKPMASTPKECDEMIEECRKNGVKLQIGFMRRFDKNFRRGKEIVDSGAIGHVAMIKSNTYGPSEPKEWMYDIRKNQGPIGEVNSHDLDICRWYAGSEPKRIYAVGNNMRSPQKAAEYPDYYDSCSLTIEFANGVIGVVTGAQYVQYGYDARTEILGTSGIVKVGTQNANSVETVMHDMTIVSDSMDSWRTLFKEAYVAEDQAFVNAIRNDEEPEVTGLDGKTALVMVHAAVRSYLGKEVVDL